MADGRRNIKVSDTEFRELKSDKPDGVSWGYYLTEIRTVSPLGSDPETPDGE